MRRGGRVVRATERLVTWEGLYLPVLRQPSNPQASKWEARGISVLTDTNPVRWELTLRLGVEECELHCLCSGQPR